jgi:hypothetical protein
MKTTKTTWVCVSRTITLPETGPVEYQEWCKVVMRPLAEGAYTEFEPGTTIYSWYNSVRILFKTLPNWGNSGTWNGIYIPPNALESIGFGGAYGKWYGLASASDNHMGSKYNGHYETVVDLSKLGSGKGVPKAPHPDQVTRLEIAEDSLRNTLSIMRNAIKQIEDK